MGTIDSESAWERNLRHNTNEVTDACHARELDFHLDYDRFAEPYKKWHCYAFDQEGRTVFSFRRQSIYDSFDEAEMRLRTGP